MIVICQTYTRGTVCLVKTAYYLIEYVAPYVHLKTLQAFIYTVSYRIWIALCPQPNVYSSCIPSMDIQTNAIPQNLA